MKALIAVVNAHTRLDYQQCIRDTWLPLINGADVRFFLGPSLREAQQDEVFLDCDDSYEGLPSKVRAISQWALAQGYEYMVKLDDDVVISPARFLSTGFHYHDFTGHRNDVRQFPVPFGFAYWLSRRSMQLLSVTTLPKDNNDEAWVAAALSQEGIVLNHEPRYVMYTGQRSDFVPAKTRALRAPKRVRPADIMLDPSLAVAWCMYFNWAGWHNVPDERILSEMRKVFKQYVTG